ncbi:MAG: putative M18 family aminopeptidase 1 [Syntrophorhabdaceae bacterium PtaU1.Bin034]|jgi:aspartyl aminopeptidase|nr:MAG: putative M18 family aminopeptidase 1 [Syntrophorhabdaceae bacterium PtaU1.Bin034]
MERQSGWKRKSKEEIKQIFGFCEDYKKFLDAAKTEREAVVEIEKVLRAHGFTAEAKGTRIYRVNRGKEVMAFRKGSRDLADGLKIIIAHIDAPRLDLKQNPLYEDVDLALLRTHYYGGIKKYQWVAMPLAIHGVVVKQDGTAVNIVIGEDENDPVFSIDDLLPHLSRRHQDEKKMSEAIDAEKLTLLFGNMPLLGAEKEPVKRAVLELLGERYGLSEDDFISAELEVVPAFNARDVGIDRSMIGAYGQDDRASAYPLLEALTALDDEPPHSALAIFTDKEEIGSEGNTGAQSHFIRIFLEEVLEGLGISDQSDRLLRRMLFTSKAVSADVNGAVNPHWQEVHEKQNACYMGRGVCVTKFTGHGGKVGASDAHAEYLAEIRKVFADAGVIWQTGELGKIDEGGGGTVAKYLAEYGMDIIDMGVPLLTMHSPFEISSKLDVFEAFRAFKAFFAS